MFWVERTFKGHLVQPPCNVQVHLQLKQVAQSSNQPYIECIQGQDIYHLCGQPVPVFHCKKLLPYLYTESTFIWFKYLTPCPIAIDLTKKSVSMLLLAPLYVFKGHDKVSLVKFELDMLNCLQFISTLTLGSAKGGVLLCPND